jgi:hypothetical protein
MPEPQLSIRSARARTLAYRLAKKERRTISQVVELALEAYAKTPPAKPKESATEFWARVRRDHGTDVDLQALIDENRKPHHGIDL